MLVLTRKSNESIMIGDALTRLTAAAQSLS